VSRQFAASLVRELHGSGAGIASAVNNTSRQVGGAIGVALIGGLASITTALALSAASLVLGGLSALVLMGGSSDP
jgi:DHA2 family methylenomycin A resistance protein-like MFS transporter